MATAYINGNIYSMASEDLKYQAFVVEDGKFLYCGNNKEAIGMSDKIVDLKGQTVLPGMIDTHRYVYASSEKDNNQSVSDIQSPYKRKQAQVSMVEKTLEKCKALGITGIHPIQNLKKGYNEYTDVYQLLSQQDKLNIRVYMGFDVLPGCTIRSGLGNDLVKYGFYTIYLDENSDVTQEELDELVLNVSSQKVQTAAFTVGEKETSMVLNAIANAISNVQNNKMRFRLCTVSLSPELLKRANELSVSVEVDESFLADSMKAIQNPMKSIAAMVKSGKTTYEAVSMFTSKAAYMSFDENKKGTIEEGKLADFICISEDIFKSSKEDIEKIYVDKTFLSGNSIFARH